MKDFDTQSSPTNAATAMRAAIGSHPTAIVGSSFVLGAGLPLAAQSGLPVVGDGFAPGYSGHKNMFPAFGDEAGAVSDWEFVAAKKYAGASKVALLGSSLYASDLQRLVADAPKAGVDLVMQDLTLPLVPNSAQILAAAQQIKASGAQAVAAIGVEGLAEFQIDLNQLGAKVHIISSDFYPGTTSENGLFYSEPWANQYVTGNAGVTAIRRGHEEVRRRQDPRVIVVRPGPLCRGSAARAGSADGRSSVHQQEDHRRAEQVEELHGKRTHPARVVPQVPECERRRALRVGA